MASSSLGPPEGEDPRDTALLRRLRCARERGDKREEQHLIGQLITGWQVKVEDQQRLWGLPKADCDEVTSAWIMRMTKVLMRKAEFSGPFGAVALKNGHWVRREILRRKERRPEELSENPHSNVDRAGEVTDDFAIDNSTNGLLELALAALSDRDRKILDGLFGQDRAASDIAKELGMTPGALRVAQHRALGKIRERLEAEGVTRADF
jgi:RNA polymerase sigma-70 factor (ECF subfamily)